MRPWVLLAMLVATPAYGEVLDCKHLRSFACQPSGCQNDIYHPDSLVFDFSTGVLTACFFGSCEDHAILVLSEGREIHLVSQLTSEDLPGGREIYFNVAAKGLVVRVSQFRDVILSSYYTCEAR